MNTYIIKSVSFNKNTWIGLRQTSIVGYSNSQHNQIVLDKLNKLNRTNK